MDVLLYGLILVFGAFVSLLAYAYYEEIFDFFMMIITVFVPPIAGIAAADWLWRRGNDNLAVIVGIVGLGVAQK